MILHVRYSDCIAKTFSVNLGWFNKKGEVLCKYLRKNLCKAESQKQILGNS